jgi:hypothetical protein
MVSPREQVIDLKLSEPQEIYHTICYRMDITNVSSGGAADICVMRGAENITFFGFQIRNGTFLAFD